MDGITVLTLSDQFWSFTTPDTSTKKGGSNLWWLIRHHVLIPCRLRTPLSSTPEQTPAVEAVYQKTLWTSVPYGTDCNPDLDKPAFPSHPYDVFSSHSIFSAVVSMKLAAKDWSGEHLWIVLWCQSSPRIALSADIYFFSFLTKGPRLSHTEFSSHETSSFLELSSDSVGGREMWQTNFLWVSLHNSQFLNTAAPLFLLDLIQLTQTAKVLSEL